MKSQRKESHAQNQNAIYKNWLSQRCHKIAVLCMQKKKSQLSLNSLDTSS